MYLATAWRAAYSPSDRTGVQPDRSPGRRPHWQPGGYADLALVDIDGLSAVPAGLALTDAAALLHDAPTALTLFDLTAAASAGSVLVLGASGGLGLMLVQLARASGVRTVAVARDEAKLERIRVMAPDASVVDFEQSDWIERLARCSGRRRGHRL